MNLYLGYRLAITIAIALFLIYFLVIQALDVAGIRHHALPKVGIALSAVGIIGIGVLFSEYYLEHRRDREILDLPNPPSMEYTSEDNIITSE